MVSNPGGAVKTSPAWRIVTCAGWTAPVKPPPAKGRGGMGEIISLRPRH
jgi:hypothetical protein